MIRHALVEENARLILYGTMDVELCPHTLEAQVPMYAALARRLPRPAVWLVTPLSRTQRTAAAIFAAGYPPPELPIEPGLIEQHSATGRACPCRRAGAADPAAARVLAARRRRAAAGRGEHGRRDPACRGRNGAARRSLCRGGCGGGEPWRRDPGGSGACSADRAGQRAACLSRTCR